MVVMSENSSVITSEVSKPRLPEDKLDSMVFQTMESIQILVDTAEDYKGIKVASYDALKGECSKGEFTLYAIFNVLGEKGHCCYDQFSVSVALNDSVAVNKYVNFTEEGWDTHRKKVYLKKGEFVLKGGDYIVFHTKSLKEAQSAFYEMLATARYGPMHQPPVAMKLTELSPFPCGPIYNVE